MADQARRRLLKGLGASGVALAGRLPMARAAEGPIRIACVASFSGPNAFFQAIRVGAEIARDRINRAGGIDGRPIELVFRDDHGSPNEAVAAVREFSGDGINLLFGTPLTSCALAVLPVMSSMDSLFIVTGSANLALTHELYNKNSFAIIENDYIIRRMHGQLMAERHPDVTRWGAIFPDIATGHASWQFFTRGLQETFAKMPGKTLELTDPVLTKLGSTEFRTQIARLMGSPIDGLFNVMFGTEAITFYQQGNAMGLFRKIKINAETATGLDIGKTLHGSTPDIWSYVHWYYKGYPNNPLAEELAREYSARTGEAVGSPYAFPGHSAVMALAAAITKAKSTATTAVISALEGLQYDSAKGPAIFRKEDHQGLARVNYIRLGPTDGADGWEVKEFRDYAAADNANPPTPGVKFSL